MDAYGRIMPICERLGAGVWIEPDVNGEVTSAELRTESCFIKYASNQSVKTSKGAGVAGRSDG